MNLFFSWPLLFRESKLQCFSMPQESFLANFCQFKCCFRLPKLVFNPINLFSLWPLVFRQSKLWCFSISWANVLARFCQFKCRFMLRESVFSPINLFSLGQSYSGKVSLGVFPCPRQVFWQDFANLIAGLGCRN